MLDKAAQKQLTKRDILLFAIANGMSMENRVKLANRLLREQTIKTIIKRINK